MPKFEEKMWIFQGEGVVNCKKMENTRGHDKIQGANFNKIDIPNMGSAIFFWKTTIKAIHSRILNKARPVIRAR